MDFSSLQQKCEELVELVCANMDTITYRTNSGCEGTMAIGFRLYCMTDARANRMRFMIPVLRYNVDEDSGKLSQILMQANYDSALDAKYALNNGILWATFMHPLDSLSHVFAADALKQVVTLAKTTGTEYRSSNLVFIGGPKDKNKVNTTASDGRLDKETILANAAKATCQDKQIDTSDVPDAFIDPVTLEIMNEPAVIPSGYSFDLTTIEQIIRTSGKDPFTRKPLEMGDIRLNRALKEAINEWRKKK